jgi:2-polyprenyl-6-methoxyphenol hydroxylase-like FAD-dependent oxidoreductase
MIHELQAGIPFKVYERDNHPDAREQGWAITFHWGLEYLRRLLSPETLSAVDRAQVDPDLTSKQTSNFLFLNLATLEARFRIPPNERRRVGRQRLRHALLEDARISNHVHWGKRLEHIELSERINNGNGQDHSGSDGGRDSVTAHFRDGTSVVGRLLVGAEGANSQTRQFLAPETYRNLPLPVKFVGAAVDMTPEQVKPLREIDPMLFQGCHPDTDNFLWVSILETPITNGTQGTGRDRFKVQMAISWPVKTATDAEGLSTDAERAAVMRKRAAEFHPILREAINLVSEDFHPREIVLEDWPCLEWDNRNGLVTLIGDAAHAMVMYRGEAANHGVLDAYHLVRALKKVYAGGAGQRDMVDAYEGEMRDRTSVAVGWSREACIGAHDFAGLNEKSAVLRRRALQPPVD